MGWKRIMGLSSALARLAIWRTAPTRGRSCCPHPQDRHQSGRVYRGPGHATPETSRPSPRTIHAEEAQQPHACTRQQQSVSAVLRVGSDPNERGTYSRTKERPAYSSWSLGEGGRWGGRSPRPGPSGRCPRPQPPPGKTLAAKRCRAATPGGGAPRRSSFQADLDLWPGGPVRHYPVLPCSARRSRTSLASASPLDRPPRRRLLLLPGPRLLPVPAVPAAAAVKGRGGVR